MGVSVFRHDLKGPKFCTDSIIKYFKTEIDSKIKVQKQTDDKKHTIKNSNNKTKRCFSLLQFQYQFKRQTKNRSAELASKQICFDHITNLKLPQLNDAKMELEPAKYRPAGDLWWTLKICIALSCLNRTAQHHGLKALPCMYS